MAVCMYVFMHTCMHLFMFACLHVLHDCIRSHFGSSHFGSGHICHSSFSLPHRWPPVAWPTFAVGLSAGDRAMSNFRASSTIAIPHKAYEKPKGAVYFGVGELDRHAPIYDAHEDVFEEYLGNKSLSPSRHRETLAKSSGLMELHYNTMRKKAAERAAWPTARETPCMDRSYTAIAGYSGLIPGKVSNNVCGCSHKVGSQLAFDTHGKHFKAPMSGLTFTLGSRSEGLGRSCSLPQLSPSGSRGFPGA